MNFQISFVPFVLVFSLFVTNFSAETSANGGPAGHPFFPSRSTQVCCHPREFFYHNFLTDQECDRVNELAKDRLQKSMVADVKTGNNNKSTLPMNKDMFVKEDQDEIVYAIESRISSWILPLMENGMGIQVLHYEKGQIYSPHWNYFQNKTNQAMGGHKIMTVVIYLSNVERVGETVFPQSEMKESQTETAKGSECATKGYAVKPKKGDALLVSSLHPEARMDLMSLHRRCPVTWLATNRIHARRSDHRQLISASEGEDCRDKFNGCVALANLDECKSNAQTMIGTAHSPGLCRKTCLGC